MAGRRMTSRLNRDNEKENKQAHSKPTPRHTWSVPRTPQRACKDAAIARLLLTPMNLSDSDDDRKKTRKRLPSARRTLQDSPSVRHPSSRTPLSTANLDSPLRHLRSLSISSDRAVKPNTPRRPVSEYRSSSIGHLTTHQRQQTTDAGDSDYEMDDDISTTTSDESGDTSESESLLLSDGSEGDDDDWEHADYGSRRGRLQYSGGTPKTPRSGHTQASSTSRLSKTPRSFLPKRTLSIPPTPSRTAKSDGERLPGREHEYDTIHTFISGKLRTNCGGCMYISGLPGTGKTASVNAVLQSMSDKRDEHAIPPFDRLVVNGMQVNHPKQVYVQIYQQLTGQILSAKLAAQRLEHEFCSTHTTKGSKSSSTLLPVVLLIDELDLLCTRRQDVLYNLFDWPTRGPRGRRALIVLAIANTMDLPERLLHPRVASRLGLTRLTFAPYTHEQLIAIVQSGLADSVPNKFQDKALELAARKVAAVSGDVRRALDICRRAAEMVQDTSAANKPIGIGQITAALKEMFTTPKLNAIKACSLYEKLFLRALMTEFKARSAEEARLDRCILQMCALCRLEGVPCPTSSEVFDICSSLGSHKLLLTEPGRQDVSMWIRLNCSTSDVLFALKPSRPA